MADALLAAPPNVALVGGVRAKRQDTNAKRQASLWAIIAIGQTFVIITGGIDLSVGSVIAFSGVFIAVLLRDTGLHPLAVFALLLMLTTAFGAGMGFLIDRLAMPAFIVTLGTMGIFRSLVTWLADGGTLSLDYGLRTLYRPVYYGGIGWLTWPIITFAVVAVLGEWVMRHSRFGRHVEAIGSNDRVARYSGIDVNRVRLLTYVGLGMLVGLAVVLYVPRLGSASGSTGVLWELEAIAAVIIGGTALKGGRGRVWGTVVGVLILSLIDNILNLADLVSPYLNGAIQGVIIVLAVVLQREKRAAE